jgi:hypothetical protein
MITVVDLFKRRSEERAGKMKLATGRVAVFF